MSDIALSDGTILAPDGKVVVAKRERNDLIVTARRKEEFPKNGKLYSVICALELWGMPPPDIAEVLGVNLATVESVITTDPYQGFRSDLIEGVMNAETGNIRHIFMSRAADAAQGIVSLINSDIPEVRMFAQKETLDRAGFRPADIVEHRHTMENALQIVHIREDEKKSIDVDFTEVGEQ